MGNIANVSYLLCHGLAKERGIDATLAIKDTPLNQPFIYGKDNNPYNVKLQTYRTKKEYLRVMSDAVGSDILHIHGGISYKQLIFELLHRTRNVRHFHGSDVRNIPKDKKRLLHVGSSVVGEHVLVSTIDLLNHWGGAKYLPNPIEPTFFESYSIEEEYSIFLPTRIEEQTKDTRMAFEAWDTIKTLDKDVLLKAMNWGEDAPYYRIKYKNDNRIRWLSPMSRSGIKLEMEKSAVIWGQFRFSSLGLVGLTELEAMALGKVVLMKYEAPKTLNDSPPIINAKNPDDLAHITANLLSQKDERSKLGQQARGWAKRHHSIEKVTQQLVETYNEIIR
ncbi:MAG: glycosyltransferase [Thaumarchaeota archaeon]|nr:glycosyltransferase [Nitrososphaerota archaeon]